MADHNFRQDPLHSDDTESLLKLYKEGGDREKKDDDNKPKDPPLKPINYKFLDGLRGFGAFAVYLNHIMDQFYPYSPKKDMESGHIRPGLNTPPEFFRDTPVRVFYAGYFWVVVFFILSGFVLPLNFFRTGRQSSITGGTCRRYFRLMIPVLFALSLVWFFLRMDAYGDRALARIDSKTLIDVFLDGLIGTWVGDDSWLTSTWTLGIELIATFWIYLVSQTVRAYKARMGLYLVLILSIWLIQLLDEFKVTSYKLTKLTKHLPMFFIGTMTCDFDNQKDSRPLDTFRDLWWPLATLKNLVLLFIFFSYGSINKHGCYYDFDEPCPYFNAVTFDSNLPWWICNYLGAIAIFLLCLTSEGFQWILESRPMQFLGEVSYMLYLVHQIFIEWCMVDFYYHYELDDEIGHHAIVIFQVLIFTPLLFLVAWILTKIIDTPAKDFAYDCDVQCRIEIPKAPKKPAPQKEEEKKEDQKQPEEQKEGGAAEDEEPEDPRPACWKFILFSWKIWIFVAYFVVIITIAEIFNAVHGQPSRYHNERGY